LPEPARAIAAGMYFSLALGASGRVYAWGWNSQGQLGLGDGVDRAQPTAVPGLARVRAIAAGQAHGIALDDTHLHGWGSNAAGQLGAAERTQRAPARLLAVMPLARGRDA
jgi:alpha-tubulin suppressor-like RCC1 family protein